MGETFIKNTETYFSRDTWSYHLKQVQAVHISNKYAYKHCVTALQQSTEAKSCFKARQHSTLANLLPGLVVF